MNEQDPRQKEKRPPMPKQEQTPPGYETKMHPKPDHGEQSYQGHGRLKGKVAIITGSDSGIGKAIALAYAREGADVLVSYWNEHVDAKDTLRLVEEAGQKAVLHAGDISDERVCQEIVEQAMAVFGRIDILVNNAAFQQTYKELSEITPEVLEHTFGTNVFSMFYLVKHALPHMQPGSAVINTASIEAYQPDPSLLPYASTKGAIVTFTKGLSKMADQARHPRERGRPRAYLDAPDPGKHVARARFKVWRDRPDRAPRSAGRTGAHVRAVGLRRCQLHERRHLRCHRR